MAYLDINAQSNEVNNPNGKPAPKQDDTSKKDYKMVMALLEKGKAARKSVDGSWDKYWSFYKGNQWEVKRPSYKASPNINIIRATVQTILPIMTDASPGFDVEPRDPTDYKFADILSKAVQVWWERTSMQHTIVDVIFDSLIYDAAILKTCWDSEAEEGLGDITCMVVDPRNIYLPQDAEDFDKKCAWVIQRLYMSVGELKRMFPDKAEDITGTFQDRGEDSKQPKEEAYNGEVLLVSPTDRKSSIDSGDMQNPEGSGNDDKEVMVLECWLDDFSMEEYELENDDGSKEKTQKRKYPTGKVITVLPDRRLVLQTKANPYKDGKKPFTRFVDTLVPRKFWGEGEVEPLIETQKLINKNMATLVDWMNMMTNPVWIVDNDSGVDPRTLTNQVGAIIPKNRGSMVTREPAPSMPPQMFEMYGLFRQLADTQSGVHDVTQGRKPAGVTAAEAINSLQDAAQTRIRLKERNLQTSMTKMGYLVISRMMQYYSTPRMLKISGDTEYPQYLEFFVEEKEDGFGYTYRDYEFDEETKTYYPAEWQSPDGTSKGMFDISVQAGTSLPFMKEKRGQLARNLFQDQVIDAEELLTVLEWPRKEEVLRRKQEADQAAAQQAPPAAPMGGVGGM